MTQEEMKALLEQAWKEVFKTDAVSENADFFEAGGDSIMAVQLSAWLVQKGVKLDLVDVFMTPKFSELAEKLSETEPYYVPDALLTKELAAKEMGFGGAGEAQEAEKKPTGSVIFANTGKGLGSQQVCDTENSQQVCDQKVCDQQVCDQKVCDQKVCDQQVCDQQVCGQQVCDQQVCGQQVCNQQVCSQQVCNQQVCGQQVCNQQVCSQQVCNQQVCSQQVCNQQVCSQQVCSPMNGSQQVCNQQVCSPMFSWQLCTPMNWQPVCSPMYLWQVCTPMNRQPVCSPMFGNQQVCSPMNGSQQVCTTNAGQPQAMPPQLLKYMSHVMEKPVEEPNVIKIEKAKVAEKKVSAEDALLHVMQGLLPNFNKEVDFFEQGLTSFDTVKMVTRIAEQGYVIEMKDIYLHSTFDELVGCMK